LPRNAFEICDLIFELWFNSSYAGDVSSLAAVNDLVTTGKLGAPFKKVDVIQVPILRNRGFIDYFVESADVFDAAYEQTQRLLGKAPEPMPVKGALAAAA
jgi:hypothetical protein